MGYRALQHDMRIDPHQTAIMIGVAVAGPGRAGLDVAHHRAGIAADLVGHSGRVGQHEQAHRLAALCSYTNDPARRAESCQALSHHFGASSTDPREARLDATNPESRS